MCIISLHVFKVHVNSVISIPLKCTFHPHYFVRIHSCLCSSNSFTYPTTQYSIEKIHYNLSIRLSMFIWFVSSCGSFRQCYSDRSCKCLFINTWADIPGIWTSSTLLHIDNLLLKVIVPIYTLISSLEELLLFHILAKTWHSERLILCQYNEFETESHCGLICIPWLQMEIRVFI